MRSLLIITLATLTGPALVVAQERAIQLPFRKVDAGKVPGGWTAAKTGTGEGSVWKVLADETAPAKTGYALAQTAESPSAMFNLCVADTPKLKDGKVTVSFKAVKGEKDQGGGIVWRYQDAENYYIARMNPLEDNFRLYKVVAGKRTQLATKEQLKALTNEWHKLSVKMVGNKIECSFNGKKYLEAKDDTFDTAGKVGLWTKADAQTYFDQFVIAQTGD